MEFRSFVLAAATTDVAEEPAAREHADAVEFRMDGADDPLAQLRAYDGELPVIATNRPTWEGGEAPAGSERLDVLRAATDCEGVEAVDVELESVDRGDAEELVRAASEADVALIVSVHDFEGTPEAGTCRSLLDRAGRHGDVAKLAVTATAPEDVLALLQATSQATRAGETVATMAMGEVGRHSRAIAQLYGSKIGYAPIEPAGATAPGQFDLATLRSLTDLLGRPSVSHGSDP